MRTSSSIQLKLKGKNILGKTIKVSSSNNLVGASYDNQILTISNLKMKN
ncbi:hypothetical protein [Mesoplasma melaleucae]|nr:hypothetical protein [Mesoplasma melaleucae]